MHLLSASLSVIKLLKPSAFLLLIACLGAMACGKRKPPVPPAERIVQRPELSGVQRGSEVVLSWSLGPRNASDGDLLNVNRVDIYRLAEPTSARTAVSEEDFASRSTLVATVPVTPADVGRKLMLYRDRLDFAGQSARLLYAVRFVNSGGQKAAFSDFLVIEPTAKIADSPQSPTSEVTQDAIVVRWTKPSRNIDGSASPNVLGFNIYRKKGDEALKLLNPTPTTVEEYSDRTFEFGQKYDYVVRTVSLGANGTPIESADSPQIPVSPVDVFAPSAPNALTIAAAPTAVSVFFASNVERDVDGYIIFRTEQRDLPLEQWRRLTEKPIKTNTYVDNSVESGRTYYYFVKALDKAGNTSVPSQIVGEKVP